MIRDDFDNLVKQLDERFRNRRRALRLNILLWVTIGYAVMVGWLPLLLLLGAAAMFGGAAIIPLPGLLWIVGAVVLAVGLIQTALLLRVRIKPLEGVRVTRKTAPGLFRDLDEVSSFVKCRRFDRVYLTSDFNACVHRRPRLGLLGWSQTSLVLGWPLLMSTTPDEARAVVAHEFAHLSREHGRFGHWFYGLGQTWQTLMQQLESQKTSRSARKFQGLLHRFLAWYWPRLNARILLHSRASEYEADSQAAQFAGAEHLAAALWRIDCYHSLMDEKFWPEIRRLNNDLPQPPEDLFERLRQRLREGADDETIRRWIAKICRELTDQVNTHPAFSDRVRALNIDSDRFYRLGFPPPPAQNACTALFGPAGEQLEQDIVAHWRKVAQEEWRRRYGRSGALTRRLSTLDKPKGTATEATATDLKVLYERATAVADVEGLDAAEPLLREVLAAKPDHAQANLMLAHHLLSRQSPEAVELLERVINSNEEDFVPEAGRLLGEYFRINGESAELEKVRRRMSEFERSLEASRKERTTLQASDRFAAHELPPETLQELVDKLRTRPDVGRVWIAQKAFRHFPERRLFVVCVEAMRRGWLKDSEADHHAATRLSSEIRLPAQTIVVSVSGSFRRVAKRVQAVDASLVYTAS